MAHKTTDPQSDFDIRIVFERGVGEPTRIFRSMAGLIESAQRIDAHLAGMLGADVRTALVLQDVAAESLTSRLRSVVEAVPDEALKDGEIKKLIGHFLLRGKHKIIDWCDKKESITGREEVKQLQTDLECLARETDIKLLPAYAPMDATSLLADIAAVNDALASLERFDAATLASAEGLSRYNSRLSVSNAAIREIVTRERLSSTGERLLKVKKPDYLGASMWVFRYGDRMIEAKVSDTNWLHRFQANLEQVSPGDSLRVVLFEEISYGFDNEIVHTEYEVREVLGVVPGTRGHQPPLLDG